MDFTWQYQKGFSFDCNLVPSFVLVYCFSCLLIEIECGLNFFLKKGELIFTKLNYMLCRMALVVLEK